MVFPTVIATLDGREKNGRDGNYSIETFIYVNGKLVGHNSGTTSSGFNKETLYARGSSKPLTFEFKMKANGHYLNAKGSAKIYAMDVDVAP